MKNFTFILILIFTLSCQGNLYQLNDTISMVIPIYKLEYPNGFNPENNGITPDIKIELNRKDLLNGKDTQLERAIEYLTNE